MYLSRDDAMAAVCVLTVSKPCNRCRDTTRLLINVQWLPQPAADNGCTMQRTDSRRRNQVVTHMLHLLLTQLKQRCDLSILHEYLANTPNPTPTYVYGHKICDPTIRQSTCFYHYVVACYRLLNP